MIHFEWKVLANGLKVIVHEDQTTAMAAVNVLYKVGSRNEDPRQTGFAHLFEHFMFEGSANIPHFDTPLQFAGGENNAFTSNDITNYYDILPAANMETAFWLESDRMKELAFDEESLDTQKNVVMEEFKEHYINQPYGDVWHKISALSYQVHPYRWPVIGLTLEHIEQVTMPSARDFFYRFYTPNNAVLVVAGNVKADEVFALAEKWFGDIPSGPAVQLQVPQEPAQTEPRLLEVKADVPVDAIYKAYRMGGRKEASYYAADLLRDILSTGDSSRLYNALVKEQKLFSSVSAYISETIDPGLFLVEGKLNPGVTMQQADAAIQALLAELVQGGIHEKELEKVKNKVESYLLFGETNILNRAMNLAYFEMLGDAALINEEVNKYKAVQLSDMTTQAAVIFKESNCNTMYYYSNKK